LKAPETRPVSIAELVFARYLDPIPVVETPLASELRRTPRAVPLAIAVVIVLATAVSAALNLLLVYRDARSHLIIARRTFDSLQPGFAQLGTVWLPLPHILLVPLVTVDQLYYSGAAGAIVGGLVTGYGALSLFRLVRLWTAAPLAPWIALAAYLANPNLLYLQSTALTEPVFLGFFLGAVYHLAAWIRTLSYRDLALSAVLTSASALCRYDGWMLALVGSAVVLWLTVRSTGRQDAAQAMTVSFGALAGFGILLWFLYNFTIFGDPLAFQRGQFSAQAQQAQLAAVGGLDTKGHLGVALTTYAWAVIDVAGGIAILAGLAGWAQRAASRRLDRAPEAALLLLLLTPLAFNVVALYTGQSVLFTPQSDGAGRFFNVRYGLLTLPAVAVGIGLLAAGGRWRRTLAVLAVAGQTLLFAAAGIPILLQDGLVGVSSQGNSADLPAVYLRDHYSGGEVLLDDYNKGIVMFDSGLPLRTFVTTGDQPFWGRALDHPQTEVQWVIFSDDDLVGQQMADRSRLALYTEVASFGTIHLFERDHV
jgi:hypothetical protein